MSDTPAQQRPTYSPKSSPFLSEVRRVMRFKHMSRRTEASYLHYIIDFIRFCGKRHPRDALRYGHALVRMPPVYATRFEPPSRISYLILKH